jgi:YD repeat-containing protein
LSSKVGVGAGVAGSRLRWLLAFTVVLLISTAVPVLAAGSEEEPPSETAGFTPPTSEEEEVAATQVPDASEISKAIGEAEREEEEREEWLATPEAKEQREDSLLAFGDLSAGESEELLRAVFAEQLDALNSDPSRFLSDAQLVRSLGDSGAVVKDEGEGSLLETTVPVRTEDEDGQLAKVDLSLEATPEGFQTENAIADLVLPSSADEAIQVGEEGFEIAQGGATGASANRFGDKNLFYPSVLTDTDLLVAGNSFGAELFDLLRSKESPENLRFEIGVPEGAELRSDERGGAEVLREGERLTLIPNPYAVDAQGTEIPVEMEVDGSSIVLHVAHRDGDYAYPALLDPIVEDWVNQGSNWYGGQKLDALTNGAWSWTSNNSNVKHDVCCWEGSHHGLLTVFEPAFYGPEQFGQWAYSTANSKTYITHAWLIPFNRADNGCGSAQPHDYAGLWNPGDVWSPIWLNYAKTYGNLSGDGVGQSLVIGEGSGPPGVSLACKRILYAGGVGIWLNDDWGPGITSASVPSGSWFGDLAPTNITVSSWDEGLGVQFVKILNEGKSEVAIEKAKNCTGLYGARCPTTHNSQFNLTGDSFGEGIRNSSVTVSDPTGKIAEKFFTTKVDNSPPEVALEGQLAEATGEVVTYGQAEHPVADGKDKLSLPVYNLTIKAKDGDKKEDKTKRSGVKNIEVWLDGSKLSVPWSPLTSCSETSCSMEKTLPVGLTGLSAGTHKLEIKVEDFVKEIGKRNIEFQYIPATGMKDEYVMHYFPLPDGQGDEAAEEHPARPELAVNVMNGNLVYRERDIDVESTAAVDLEVERFYNSMLPSAENTEWGDGWTLAETPDLDPVDTGGSPAPDQAQLVDSSGAIEEDLALPTVEGAEQFDPGVQATLTKRAGGGYEMTDESGESATSVLFDETGQTEARLTEGYAKVDYDYESGDLDEIAVEDPGTVNVSVEELEEMNQGPEAPTYSSSIGPADPESEGPFKSPGDVAVDAQGNLWVLDKGNNRVQKFSPQGSFLAKFGAYGTGDGQFNRPTAIAIAANGDLLITDAGNTRVQRFSASGAYLSKFGSKGTGNGQFSGAGPEGIAIDASGNIWVSDTGAGRLEKFSSTGTFIKPVATKGSGSGQLGEPTAVAVDAANNIWVTDWLNNRLSVFNNNGEFKSQFGSAGTGNGQFNRPDGIEIDSEGNVWVGDQNNGRVQQFDLAGKYKSQFGSSSDPGQFEHLMGIATDPNGHIWVTDTAKNRIQKWTIPGQPQFSSLYNSAFGSFGAGNGQLKSPADVAVDGEGDLWVLDRGNSRVQHFNPQGEFVSQFGSAGTADGKFSAPSAIAFDREGNIWVTDTANNRLQKFNPKGEFLSKLGSLGSGNGQFKEPIGIAIAPSNGYVYVVDRGNNRVELFGEGGAYLGQKGAYGTGNSQLIEPSAVAIGGPSGESPYTLFVADSANNRVQRWGFLGGYLSQFGTKGTGGGQLDRPEAIEVDIQGDVWVGDRNNGRIQVFNEVGKYVDQVGAKGSGQGQFSFTAPMGISTFEGHAYVADTANSRIQDWLGLRSTPSGEVAPTDDDPRVEVETSSGLISSVEGDEAGDHTYAHTGDDLVAHKGPQGETKYVYDAAGRMTKVTLPNGTFGEVAYFSDGRVKSVKVDPAGSEPAKTTYFEYQDSPSRRTTVEPPDAPHIVYDIGADGSVLKWWNTKEPPKLDLSGALYDNRGKDGFFWEGARVLDTRAESAEGIASIDVIANGDTLVDEQTCPKPKVIECLKEESEWVTEADLHAPGHLQLEVIATDRLGESTSERFWVDVPVPQPAAPGTPVPPRFRDIAKFREEYGLEVVFPVAGEIERNERIFDLIKAWNEPNTPAGQTARATMDRWGVPLRPEDAAEMEYRERYLAYNGPIITQWGESTYPGSFAGYYVDHRAGGKIRVGFTQDQDVPVGQLQVVTGLMAPDRVTSFPYQPTKPLQTLESLRDAVAQAVGLPSSPAQMYNVSLDVEDNEVQVGTAEVSQTNEFVHQVLGLGGGINAIFQANAGSEFSGRYNADLPFLAGMELHNVERACTAGFGAWSRVGTRPNGQAPKQRYVLTAGHCYTGPLENAASVYFRSRSREEFEGKFPQGREIGRVQRRGFVGNPKSVDTDALAIALNSPDQVPGWVYECCGGRAAMRPRDPVFPETGQIVCQSSRKLDRIPCGPVTSTEVLTRLGSVKTGQLSGWHWLIQASVGGEGGDSGAPVWLRDTGNAVGLVAGGDSAGLLITPLKRSGNAPSGQSAGILSDPYLSPPSKPLYLHAGR